MFEGILSTISSSISPLFHTSEGLMLLTGAALVGALNVYLIKKIGETIDDTLIARDALRSMQQLHKFFLKLNKVNKRVLQVCESVKDHVTTDEEKAQMQDVMLGMLEKATLLDKIKDIIIESVREASNGQVKPSLRFTKLRALNFLEMELNLNDIKEYFKQLEKDLSKPKASPEIEKESSLNTLGVLKEKAAVLFGYGKFSSQESAPSALIASLNAKHEQRETAKRQRA